MSIWDKLGLTAYEEIETDTGFIQTLQRVTQVDYSIDSQMSFSQLSEMLSGNTYFKYSGIVSDSTFVIRERYSLATYFSANIKITGFADKINDEKIKLKLNYAILNRAKFMLMFFACFLFGIIFLSALLQVLVQGFSPDLIMTLIVPPVMIIGFSFVFVILLRSGQRQAQGNFKLWATYLKNSMY